MNLTPEQRATGRENFNTVIGTTRRDFLKEAIGVGLVSGGSLGAFYYGYEKIHGDPVRVGVIGTGDEGSVLLGACNPDFVQVVAIADIRPYNVYRAFHGDSFGEVAQKARPGLIARYGYKDEDEARKTVKVYDKDYHDLLNDPNVEAVIIGLPLFLHAQVALEAMAAGKHVLTEKLMAQNVAQCKEMCRVADDTWKNGKNLYLAVGHQRHYNVLYANAMDTIQRGLLGDLHYIRAQWHRGNLPGSDSWQMPLPPLPGEDRKKNKLVAEANKLAAELRKVRGEKKPDVDYIEAVEKQLRQKLAQVADEAVDAAKYGYQPKKIYDIEGKEVEERPPMEELIRWRLWDRTGGGLMAELGSHQLDAASIFVSAMHGGVKQHPLSVLAAGNRPIFPPDRDVDDHIYCTIEFPGKDYDAKHPFKSRKRIAVTYSSINGNGFGGYGEVVMGTQGTLVLEREQEVLLFKDSDTSSKVGVSKGGVLDTQASGAPAAAAIGNAATANVSRGYTEEIEHWAWCIRNPSPENQPHCGPKTAMADAIMALTTNFAAKLERRVAFNPEWFEPESDATPEAELANGPKPRALGAIKPDYV